MSLPETSTNVGCGRQLRGWFGVALMVLSLFGGFRATLRVTEEIAPHLLSEILEHVQETESRRRHLNRRDGSPYRRVAAHPGESLSRVLRRIRSEAGSSIRGHVLPNGLCAPLRC